MALHGSQAGLTQPTTVTLWPHSLHRLRIGFSAVARDTELVLVTFNNFIESWHWNSNAYDLGWITVLGDSKSWRLWQTASTLDDLIAYSLLTQELRLFRKDQSKYTLLSRSVLAGFPMNGLTRSNTNGSMLLALENLSDKRWVVTVYAKTAASTYRLIQHFNVPRPRSTWYQEYSATLELSGDGKQLVVLGLEE